MKFARAFIGVFVVLVTSVAFADTLQFTGTATNTTLTITDTYNNKTTTVTGYIDPYLGMLNGNPVTMFCVDPDHDVNLNDIWTVDVTTAGPNTDWSNTRLDNATTYGEMAYLASQMLATNNTTTRQEIQTVIWWLANNTLTATVPSGVDATTWNQQIADYKTLAANNVMTSGFEILSDVQGVKQEYLVLTPEPSSLILLMSGIGGVWIRKRRA